MVIHGKYSAELLIQGQRVEIATHVAVLGHRHLRVVGLIGDKPGPVGRHRRGSSAADCRGIRGGLGQPPLHLGEVAAMECQRGNSPEVNTAQWSAFSAGVRRGQLG